MNLIRSINKRMGSLVNRINVMAYYASRGTKIHLKEDAIKHTKYKMLHDIHFKIRLQVSNLIYWIV